MRWRFIIIFALAFSLGLPAVAFNLPAGGVQITAMHDLSGDCGSTPGGLRFDLLLSTPLSGVNNDGGSGLDWAMWVVFDGAGSPTAFGSIGIATGTSVLGGTFADDAVNTSLTGLLRPASAPFIVRAYDTTNITPGSVASITGAPLIATSGPFTPQFVSEACSLLGIGQGGINIPPPFPSDGRINRFGEPGAVYTDPNGIFVYDIDNTSRGKLVVSFLLRDLPPFPYTPPQNTLLAASADGHFAIYLLVSGEFQVNIGPDAEGKVYVTVFRGAPAGQIHHYDFFSSTPASPPSPAVPAPAHEQGKTYLVQPGDTLFSIARRFGVSLGALAAANAIVDPTRIFAGQTLIIPGAGALAPSSAPEPPNTSRTHRVQTGENLFRIALRYGVTVQALAAANNLPDPRRISVGQVLVIP